MDFNDARRKALAQRLEDLSNERLKSDAAYLRREQRQAFIDRCILEDVSVEQLEKALSKLREQSPTAFMSESERSDYQGKNKRGLPRAEFTAKMTAPEKHAYAHGEDVPARLTAKPLPKEYEGLSASQKLALWNEKEEEKRQATEKARLAKLKSDLADWNEDK